MTKIIGNSSMILLQMAIDLARINRALEDSSPQEVLTWANQHFPKSIVASSSFQTQSVALLHMIATVAPEIPIIFLDTGYHFPETLAFRKQLQDLLSLKIIDVRPRVNPGSQKKQRKELYRINPDLCCKINKVQPFDKAIAAYKAVISGIRRDQTALRAKADIVELENGQYKIHPMLNWTQKMVWQYLYDNDLPEHPLFKEGYQSVGCAPCTRAVRPGEDARAGRWADSEKTECGLHLAREDD